MVLLEEAKILKWEASVINIEAKIVKDECSILSRDLAKCATREKFYVIAIIILMDYGSNYAFVLSEEKKCNEYLH